jgi:hypothetical protein
MERLEFRRLFRPVTLRRYLSAALPLSLNRGGLCPHERASRCDTRLIIFWQCGDASHFIAARFHNHWLRRESPGLLLVNLPAFELLLREVNSCLCNDKVALCYSRAKCTRTGDNHHAGRSVCDVWIDVDAEWTEVRSAVSGPAGSDVFERMRHRDGPWILDRRPSMVKGHSHSVIFFAAMSSNSVAFFRSPIQKSARTSVRQLLLADVRLFSPTWRY